MQRAASTHQPRNAPVSAARFVAPAAALFALLVASCVTEPTQITVVVDTDLRGRAGLTISATVRRGAVTIAGDAEPDFMRPGDGGTLDGGLPSPASFTVIPLRGGPDDELVTIQVEARARDVTVRQTQRARFIPHHTVVVRMFLTALCALEDRVCGGEACSRQVFCESTGWMSEASVFTQPSRVCETDTH